MDLPPGIHPGQPHMEPQPQPPQRRLPDFIASGVEFGVVHDGQGGGGIGLVFIDIQGQSHVVVLTDIDGAIRPELAESFAKCVDVVAPREEVPVVHCKHCGIRIHGDVAARGACLTCEPATTP